MIQINIFVKYWLTYDRYNPHATATIAIDDIEKFYEAVQLGDNNLKAMHDSKWYICINLFGVRTDTDVHFLYL